VAPDVRLVTGAAQRDPDVAPSHRAGDGLGDGGLADAGRSDEQQDGSAGLVVVVAGNRRVRCRHGGRGRRRVGLGPFDFPLGRGGGTVGRLLVPSGLLPVRLRAQLTHREELQDAVLHVAQRVMVFVQHPLCLDQVEVLGAARVPRQLDDVLQERADDLGLHGLAADPGEPRQLPVHFLPNFGGKLQGGELFLQLAQVVALVVLTQLALDGLELLAQEHLPLPLAQLLLDLRLDVLLGIEHADLPLDMHQHPAEPLLDAQRFQQDLAVGGGDVDVAGHQVGELPRIVHAGQHLLDDLVRQTRLLAQLGGSGPRLTVQGDEGRVFRVERGHLFGLTHDGLEKALPVGVMDGDAPPLPVEQQLHSRQAALHLADAGDGTDGIEHFWGNALDVLPLRDGEHQPIGLAEGRLDGSQRGWASGPDGCGHPGKQHDLAQRQHRESQTFRHRSTTPSDPLEGGK
jgi:hypothetical protein